MKKDFVVTRSITEIEGKPHVETISEAELVRCKCCVHRGNPKKCMLAVICEQNNFPYFFIDNHGEWFCADGRREET